MGRPKGSLAKTTSSKWQIHDDVIRKMHAERSDWATIAHALTGVGDKRNSESLRRYASRWLGLSSHKRDVAGENNPAWRGGRTVDKHGYILVHCPEHPHATRWGRVREHRLVMERKIGRYLDPREVVDHIDGNTSNNHPDNLRLFASNAEHLAETLSGRVPNWTEDGKRRMQEAWQRKRRGATGQFVSNRDA